MRKALTLIEVMIVIFIIAIIAGIAIPQIIINQYPKSGEHYLWQGHNVLVISREGLSAPTTYLIRTEDNKEFHVLREELTPVVEKK